MLRQECRIVLNGEERWVSNVVMRGEIEDSEYAMIFLRPAYGFTVQKFGDDAENRFVENERPFR